MKKEEIINIVEKQKSFFKSGKTFSISYRKTHLKALYCSIKNNLENINEALKKDLGKSASESYMCEIGLVLSEISYTLKHLKKFTKPQRVRTPLAQFPSKSYQLPSPYGTVLIMSPWNYPFLLSFDPLIEAVAAGNTVVLKTSEYSIYTNKVIDKIVKEVFPLEYVTTIFGGLEENEILLHTKFDYIFFTGSKTVGKIVYEQAAKYNTPVTLELGGKSPCIIDEKCNIKLAAKRIVWGKFLNLGQTCVAPDYIFCHKKIHDIFIKELKSQIEKQFTSNPLTNKNYGKIINEKHFQRIEKLIDKNKVVYGGKTNSTSLQIEPTILDHVVFSDAVMQEEIFGPVLPIITYENMEEVCSYISSHDTPLAFYVFSKNKKTIQDLTTFMEFGGGCINDVVIHLATSYMSFGGLKESGLGSYHGKKGFETFSHYKSIVNKKTWLDLPMRYQPFKKIYDTLVKFFLH